AFSLSEIRWKPTYFQSMNKYFSIQGVSELPLELPPYWANNFFNSQSNIVWHIQKLSDREKDKILNRAYSILSLNSEETNASVLNRRKNQLEQEAIENVVDVAASGQNIFFSTFLFVNQANSKDALKNIERENEQIVKNSGSIIHTLIFNQLNAYVNSFFKYTDTLKERIEMPSNNIAWGFPFSTREFNDNNYNILGTNFSDGTPLFFDQFYQKSSRKNSNLFILGTSGSGKTTITKKLITYNLAVANSVIVLDPQNEYAKIGKNLRANIIHLNSSGLTVFNPLQIRKTFNPNSNETEEDFSNPDLIALHISKLETFFKIIFPSLKNVHFIAILNSLKILYQSYGFFEINNKDITKLENNEYPIISDLIQTIRKTDFDYLSESDKKVLIASFETDFGQYSVLGRMFNNISNTENLNSNFTIFNVASLMNLEKRVYQAAFFLALSFIQGQISDFYQENDKKIVLVVDEGHKFVDESNLFALNFLFDTAKTIRKYNGGLIITTQNPGDFAISGEAARKSEAIIENCQYSIFFNLKSKDIEKIDTLYRNVGGLSDEEKNFINLAQIGDMLLTVNTVDRFKLSSYYNNIEKELFFDKGDRLND
ncbi:Mbov_0397 family ICE element conjugal transfer ATPase, partial [Mesomycoplasma ovipneumoniae]|uniref:Mbov_0397 family ICE element conjugal transfer ATPase n=1 Tax=Mesomycoplasma ovipneumoniae TaxID=29562 RepID=UPI003080165C